MKIAVLGATGWVGSALVTEAKARDHEVIAIVRDPAKLTAKGVSTRAYDLHSNGDFAPVVEGADVLSLIHI